MSERIELKTEDGVTIVGDYYEGGRDKAVLLLHMMPATRASWTAFANALVEAGFSVLAIDLRGHGESVKGASAELDYKNFSDEDHQASIFDAAAAVKFLKTKKKMKEISLGGASIGANLAPRYAAANPDIRSLILLSPGLMYRGVDAEAAVPALASSVRTYFLASRDDEYSAASAKELFEKTPGSKKIELFTDAGHGTTMLERKPEYLRILADWIVG